MVVNSKVIPYEYEVGDVAYTTVEQRDTVHVVCEACGSTGAVTLNGAEYTCPACNGRTQLSGTMSRLVVPFVIQKIICRKCSRGCEVRYEGVRQNRTHILEASRLFSTEEEARASLAS